MTWEGFIALSHNHDLFFLSKLVLDSAEQACPTTTYGLASSAPKDCSQERGMEGNCGGGGVSSKISARIADCALEFQKGSGFALQVFSVYVSPWSFLLVCFPAKPSLYLSINLNNEQSNSHF